MMKDWLGQADNCAFWAVLLRALCANGSASMFATSSSQVLKLLDLDIVIQLSRFNTQRYVGKKFIIDPEDITKIPIESLERFIRKLCRFPETSQI